MKKTQITRTTLLAILFFIASVTQAQSFIDSLVLEKVFDRTPYIFEGTVIDKCYFKDPDDKLIYTANIIEITKFVKGSLQCGTVTIITEGGEKDNERLTVSHTAEFTKGYIGLFACIPTHLKTTTDCPATDNTVPLSMIFNEEANIDYFADHINKEAEGFHSKFEELNELYYYITNELGYSIIDCNSNRLAEFNREMQQYKSKTKPLASTKDEDNVVFPSRSAGDWNQYNFTTPIITGHTTKYCEFDVRISANDDSTFLDEGAFRVKFNPLAFGTQIANNVQVTLGTGFDPSVYTPINKINKSDSVFSIWVESIIDPNNRKKITTAKQVFVHLKIPFINCAEYPNISLDTFANAYIYNTYTKVSNALTITRLAYASTILNDTRAGEICEPNIISIYESANYPNRNIAGGTKRGITIEGTNFLNSKGKVYFVNSNIGYGNYVPLDAYDIQIWNDTLIKLTLPSLIDSGIYTGGAYKRSSPGTGYPRVQNFKSIPSDTLSTLQSRFIQIPYLARNISKKNGSYFYKDNMFLFSNNVDGEYFFQLNTNVPQPMKECIRAAINRWRCTTGVNFSLDEINTTTDSVKGDTKNVITLGSYAPIDSNVLAATYSVDTACFYSTTTSKPFSVKGIDIKINIAKLNRFFYDTTGTQNIPAGMYDFFHIILHELGHAHGLGHVNNPDDLMYYSESSAGFGGTNAIDRRFIHYNDQLGGDYIMANSTSNIFGLTCAYNTPMVMQDTLCRLSPINAIADITNLNVTVYPNPFRNEFKVVSNEQINAYQLLDIQGRVIQEEKVNPTNEFTIKTSSLSAGIYWIKLFSKSKSSVNQVICE